MVSIVADIVELFPYHRPFHLQEERMELYHIVSWYLNQELK
jgi:hypothetical protein